MDDVRGLRHVDEVSAGDTIFFPTLPTLQAIEAAIFAPLTILLIAFSAWWLRQRVTDCRPFRPLFVASGKVIGEIHRRHRPTEFRSFLDSINGEVPRELEVHLVIRGTSHLTRLRLPAGAGVDALEDARCAHFFAQ